MSSVDRVSLYSKVEPEADHDTGVKPPLLWPQYGIVTFEGTSLYAQNGSKILRNLWCCIRAQEKVSQLLFM